MLTADTQMKVKLPNGDCIPVFHPHQTPLSGL